MTELLNYQITTDLLRIYVTAYEKCFTIKRYDDKTVYLVNNHIHLGICNAVVWNYNLTGITITEISEFFFSSKMYRWRTPYFLYKWGEDPIEGLMPRIQWLTRRSKELL